MASADANERGLFDRCDTNYGEDGGKRKRRAEKDLHGVATIDGRNWTFLAQVRVLGPSSFWKGRIRSRLKKDS
jgi:hypothetical protein